MDQTDLALRIDRIDIEREEIIEIGEALCLGKDPSALDDLPGSWPYVDKRSLVEYVAEYMCHKDLANPTPKEDRDELFQNRAWEAYQRIDGKFIPSTSRSQIEHYSGGICDAYSDGMETRYRVYAIQDGQNSAAEEIGESESGKWTYGDAILIDRAIVEEVCDA